MGKASRWIRNLLLGKKEDKTNNDNGNGYSGGAVIPPPGNAIIPTTPRRRWSFRRSNSTQKVTVNHKSCRSFDSIMTSQLLSQALFDYAIQHQNHTTKLVGPPTTRTVSSVVLAVTAATKIQAAFRAYLARKALCALRGLVKLQALVRGHLVRKRTAAMVRCMSALVAIQVRARFQRIQMVENTGSTSKQLEYNDKPGQPGSKPSRQSSKRYSMDSSPRQSSRRYLMDSSPSTHEKSMRFHDKSVNEVVASSQTSTLHDEPNYMTKTESSRAKARSHSEPRQRPTKQKRQNRRTSSNEGLLLTNLYGPTKSTNDSEIDSASTCTNGSSYYTTLYEYKMTENLY